MVRILLRQWSRLYLNDDGVLYRRANGRNQLLFPKEYRDTVFRELYNGTFRGRKNFGTNQRQGLLAPNAK